MSVVMTAATYGFGRLIQTRENGALFHKLGIVTLVASLVVFKYLGMFTGFFNSILELFQERPVVQFTHLLPPLGISYLVFKHISYLTDLHWKTIEAGTFGEILCYSSLFTIFLAGPIERFERFKPQIEQIGRFSIDHAKIAFERIVLGVFKKTFVADWIGYFINPIWEKHPQPDTGMFIVVLLGYSIQIYMDFAGYSDIAIGSSRLFGLKICENFNYPYFQQNISQFWRSWHISLSDWIRDYVFFPLSKHSTNKVYLLVVVPLIAMGLCGLWHGAAPHFVAWGCWHGAGISLLQMWNHYKRKHMWAASLAKAWWFNIASTTMTFVFVTIGWLWFR